MSVEDPQAVDRVRIAFVAALCALLLLVDLSVPDATDVAQLYAAALLPLYGVRSRVVLGGLWLFAVLLIAAGCPPLSAAQFGDALTSRILSAALVTLVVVGLDRVGGREQELVRLALIDPLTGVFNRRSFFEFSGKAEARARRGGNPFAVLMIDIDHFKRINDEFGHPAGDRVIKALADVCARALRPSDLVARYGGEEFVINLLDTDQARASTVAERLREAVEATGVSSEHGTIKFTVSIGLATCSDEASLSDAIALADKALYAAKRNGRNRVEVAKEALPRGARASASSVRSIDVPRAKTPAETVILVVDDETDILSVVAEQLRDRGYTVHTAENPTDALRILETDPAITLVFTDIVMPGGSDGFDLGRQAELIHPGIKMLYMSGYAPPTTLRDGRGEGARVLRKPFRLNHVLENVEYVLQH